MNILQIFRFKVYFIIFPCHFPIKYSLFFSIFIHAIIISANCNAFSIIKQGGYILRKINKWYISIFRTFYMNEKENCCPRMFPKLFFIKHFKFQSITSSFSNDIFNYLMVYRWDRTWEHTLLRYLAGDRGILSLIYFWITFTVPISYIWACLSFVMSLNKELESPIQDQILIQFFPKKVFMW